MDFKQHDPELRRDQIAFAEVAFSENARAIMAPRSEDEEVGEGTGRAGYGAGVGCDPRLVRSSNFLQLSRADLCGKLKTLLVCAVETCCRVPVLSTMTMLLRRWGIGLLFSAAVSFQGQCGGSPRRYRCVELLEALVLTGSGVFSILRRFVVALDCGVLSCCRRARTQTAQRASNVGRV